MACTGRGSWLPCYAPSRKRVDFKAWRIPDKLFSQTREYIDFHRAVGKLAADIAERLKTAPEWASAGRSADAVPSKACKRITIENIARLYRTRPAEAEIVRPPGVRHEPVRRQDSHDASSPRCSASTSTAPSTR